MGLTYTIGTLSGLTGLSQHTIRAWEKRYEALTPLRTDTNRRLYQDADVQRLLLLKQVVESGHSIGQVAKLPTERLKDLASSSRPRPVSFVGDTVGDGPSVFLDSCRNAIFSLDGEALEDSLVRGNAAMGILGLLDGVVIPLLADIERGWSDGSIRISHEHLASAVLRTYLDRIRISMPGAPNAPRLLVTTPRNQNHEIGALMVAILAATQAWSVTYLGPNLPAEEIAHAASQCSARAVGLSLVFPSDDPSLPDELRTLRRKLNAKVPIIVGGRATSSYAEVLQEIKALVSHDLWSLRDTLHLVARTEAA